MDGVSLYQQAVLVGVQVLPLFGTEECDALSRLKFQPAIGGVGPDQIHG
jgi:hypothetical protein